MRPFSQIMRLLPGVLLLMGGRARGQSIQILPAPPAKGSATFHVMLASAERAIAALQWRIEAAGPVEIAEARITAGSAAKEAHKRLTCAAVGGRSDAARSYACVLAGGTSAMPDGSVAVARFVVSAVSDGAAVRVTNVSGVSPDGRRVPVAGAEARLAVTGPSD